MVEYILEYFNVAHASFVCFGMCSDVTVMAEHQITHLFCNFKNVGNFVYPKKEGRGGKKKKSIEKRVNIIGPDHAGMIQFHPLFLFCRERRESLFHL